MGFIKAGAIVTDRVQIIPAASLYHNCSRGIRNRINSHNPCHIAIRQRWHINYLINWMLLLGTPPRWYELLLIYCSLSYLQALNINQYRRTSSSFPTTISSNLPLSLTNSLIYQDFISFHTLLSIRTQRAINYQVNFTT